MWKKSNPEPLPIRILLGVVILTICTQSGCAQGKPLMIHSVRDVILHNIHYRRPGNTGPDLQAVPGEEDFFAKPLPDAKFDCKPLKALFSHVDLKGVRKCFRKIQNSGSTYIVTYQLDPQIQPYLELNEIKKEVTFEEEGKEQQNNNQPNGDVAACVRKVLNRVPVPREIFFQSNEIAGQVECYSSRIQIRNDEWLGLSSFFNKTLVTISMPPDPFPSNDDDLIFLLGSWALMPFWDTQDSKLEATLVPSGICQKCIGSRTMLKVGQSLPLHWSGIEGVRAFAGTPQPNLGVLPQVESEGMTLESTSLELNFDSQFELQPGEEDELLSPED